MAAKQLGKDVVDGLRRSMAGREPLEHGERTALLFELEVLIESYLQISDSRLRREILASVTEAAFGCRN